MASDEAGEDCYLCVDDDKNGFCTCSMSFEGCDCTPVRMDGSPTACKDCQSKLVRADACDKCECHPCRCTAAGR